MSDNPDWTDEEARRIPVPADRCIWCKCDLAASDSDPLDTGERLCRACRGDLREWKRTRFADMLVASSLEQSVKTALFDDWQGLMDMIARIHGDDPNLKTLPTRTSNANEHREHGDGTGGDRSD